VTDRLQRKTAIITGAASGIGRAAALRFAEEGAAVAALDINPDGLAVTVQHIRNNGGTAEGFPVDVTDAAQVETAVRQIVAQFGRIDTVFNVAGGSGRHMGDGPVHTCTPEGWAYTLQLNLTSVFYVCRFAVDHMLTDGGGSIINLSSVLGLVGNREFATHAYAASKSGIIGLARAMAIHYAPDNIRVNVIAPGLIETQMSQRASQNEQIVAMLPTVQPLTGTLGQPDDVAAAAVYLASDDARFVTGIVLPIDGGWSAG
jgi:NAD(P)-dependent dehydrogenase (short-subunit alcohol dehydrogenase family)